MTNHFTCNLCDISFHGYGNNPYPLCDKEDYKAKCCDSCNILKVLPARMGLIIHSKKSSTHTEMPREPSPVLRQINLPLMESILKDYRYALANGNATALEYARKWAKKERDWTEFVGRLNAYDTVRIDYDAHIKSFGEIDWEAEKAAALAVYD